MCYILFIVNNTLAILLSIFLSDIAFGERSALRRFFVFVVTFPLVIFFSMFVLGLVGQLTAAAVAVLLGCFCIFFGILDFRLSKVRLRSISKEPHWFITSKTLWLFLSGGLIISVAGGLFVGKFVLNGTCFGPDDLSYHTTFAAYRIVNGDLSIGLTNYHAYFPFNAEIISTWFMLPFHNDSMASLAGWYWLVLMSAAIIFLLSSMQNSVFAALFTVAIVLSSALIQKSVKSFSAVDLAGPVMVLTAVTFALPLDKNRSKHQRFVDVLYSGLAAGFAAGVKVSFTPICIILFLWFALTEFKTLSLRIRVKVLLIFTCSSFLAGGFWYLRNFYLTGNPLFPMETCLFSGPFPSEWLSRTSLIAWILGNPRDAEQWKYLIKAHMNWPVSLFLLSVSGYIGSICSLVRRGGASGDQKASARFLLILVGLVFCAFYPLMPFTGATANLGSRLNIQLRFCALQFIIGVILFSFLLERSGKLNLFWFWAAVLALALRWGFRAEKIILTVGALAFLKAVSFSWHRYIKDFFVRIPVKTVVLVIYLAAGLFGLLAFYPRQKQLTDQRIYDCGKRYFPIGLAWRALEQLPPGSSVTMYGVYPGRSYPYFGRQLQLKPVITEADGIRRKPFHVYRKTMPEKAIFKEPGTQEEISEFQLGKLIDNLVSGGIEYVLVSRWWTGEWPIQHTVLAVSGGATKIYDDGYSVIWQLTDGFESDKPELRK